MGQGEAARHDRQPSRLDPVAAKAVGCSHAVLRSSRDGRTASPNARIARGGGKAGRAERYRSLAACAARGTAGPRGGCIREDQGHAGCVVRLRVDALHGSWRARRAENRRRLTRERTEVPCGSVSRGIGPASRLVPFLAAGLLHDERRAALQGPAHPRLCRRRAGSQDVQVRGQCDCAAEGFGHPGRRNSSAVGCFHGLFRRALDLRRNPQARGGSVSTHP